MRKKELLKQIQSTYQYSDKNKIYYAIVNGFLISEKDADVSNFTDEQKQNVLLDQYMDMEKEYEISSNTIGENEKKSVKEQIEKNIDLFYDAKKKYVHIELKDQDKLEFYGVQNKEQAISLITAYMFTDAVKENPIKEKSGENKEVKAKKLKVSDNFKKKAIKGTKFVLGGAIIAIVLGTCHKAVHDAQKDDKQNQGSGMTPGATPTPSIDPTNPSIGAENPTPSITGVPTSAPTNSPSLETQEFIESFEDTQKLLVNRYDLDANIASSLLVMANSSSIDENTFDTLISENILSNQYEYANGYTNLGIDTFCEQRRDVYNGQETYGSIMCLSELFIGKEDKEIALQLDNLEKTLLTSTTKSEKASAYKEMLEIAYQTNKDEEVSASIKYIYGLTTLDVCGMLLGEEGIVSQEILDEATLYMEQNKNPLYSLYQGEFVKGKQKTLK